MSIQFHCPGCRQPIEVDREWAERLVACPYCRQTVTAPAESDLELTEALPVARGLADAAPGQAPTDAPLLGNAVYAGAPAGPGPVAAGVPPSSMAAWNRVATLAMVFAFVALAFRLGAVGVLLTHADEMRAMQEAMQERANEVGLVNAALEQSQHQTADQLGWMTAFTVLHMAAGMFILAAITCGILGLRSPLRRARATTALVMSGLLILMLCVGV